MSRASRFPFDAPQQLRFYRARNAIYHLFRALPPRRGRLTVIAPDYYSGNEVLAIRAAGAAIHYAKVDRSMRLDPDEVERLCERHDPDVLFVIHYLGWPQPIRDLAAICRRRGIVLVEDCALALLSEADRRALGSFGDYAIFCLYKTVPVPNGALLVANGTALPALENVGLRSAGPRSVVGRMAELLAVGVRTRASSTGAMLHAAKRGVGRVAGALKIHHAPVGDIGFDLAEVDLAMSGVSDRLLERLDFGAIRRRRVENFRQLDARIDGQATRVYRDLPGGVCPLSFPILVADKPAAARALQARGIESIEMWNDGVGGDRSEMSDSVRFLREHVLELPVHQDLTPAHIAYVADQVSSLQLRMA
ncbi:MAG: DegT/DnrJ/EryC1/StrS family aminotransferase [Acidobacteria bacterium]|nr:DegT/DnrJ/EryC1/StrS family aminotransferase [Acidobacteriota bacterium]